LKNKKQIIFFESISHFFFVHKKMPWFQRLCLLKDQGYILFSKARKDDDEKKVQCTMISLLNIDQNENKQNDHERNHVSIDETWKIKIDSFHCNDDFNSFNSFNSYSFGDDCSVVSFASRCKGEYFSKLYCKKGTGDLEIILESQTLIFKKILGKIILTTESGTF
jgi:hypothetical protein